MNTIRNKMINRQTTDSLESETRQSRKGDAREHYRTRFRLTIYLILIMFVLVPNLPAQSQTDLESKVKLIFIYNFTKFIEWPDSRTNVHDPFIIGFYGENRFGEALSFLKDKTVDGRKVKIKRFQYPEELGDCHVLFVSSSVGSDSIVLERYRGQSVLLIGERDGFARRGGIINFYVENEKVRFEINISAAAEANLKISSKLLDLARIVKDSREVRFD